MPFPGTDRDAYKKAFKGKTPKQRSKIYYQEKAKNERKLKQSKKPKLNQHIDSSIKPRSFSNNTNYASRTRTQHKQSLPQNRMPSTARKSNPKTQPKINIKQQLKRKINP